MDHVERVGEIRAQMGLPPGSYNDDLGRMVYPPGNVRLAHLASVLAGVDVLGPHAPATCATCYLAWFDDPQRSESPPRCCEMWVAVCFEHHERANRWTSPS